MNELRNETAPRQSGREPALRARRVPLSVVLVAFLATLTIVQLREARANDEDRASKVERLQRTGFGLARRKKYAEAIASFEEALQLSSYPDGSIFYNIAKLSEEGLKDCRKALLYYAGYLENDPEGEYSTEVRTRHERCRKAVSSTLGRLSVMSKPDGAPIRVAGIPFGSTPLTGLEVPAGTYSITSESEEFLSASASATVEAGLEARVDLPIKRRVFKGMITVTSDPPDAAIWINDEQVASKAPFTQKELPTRTYLVRIEKPGWDRWVRYVVVERDTESLVEAVLEQTGDEVPIPPLPKNDEY
ncbi:MAG: PEGA domain-containing protein [Myxococcales bacterium]|nr:PEGA domain-containing protein [Myxococcales bacterium]